MNTYYVDPADLVSNMETYRVSTPFYNGELWHEELPVQAWINPDIETVELAKAHLKFYGQTEPCRMRMVAYEGHLLCIPAEDDADYAEDTPNIIHAAHELRWPTIAVTF